MIYQKKHPFAGVVCLVYLYQEGRDVYFYSNNGSAIMDKNWTLKKVSKNTWEAMIHPSADPYAMLNWGRNVVTKGGE
jgi:hypothetical protein